jgi:hypothetical protein
MDAKGGEIGLRRYKSINSILLTGENGLGAIKILQFGRHITSEERATMKLEDMSARLRNVSVVNGRRISPFPCLFQAIEDRIQREALI